MKEIVGDIWSYYERGRFVVCVPVNGFVKNCGEAAMGRGVALQAAQRFPGLPLEFGKRLQRCGNHCQEIGYGLYGFPTKHNWWERSDLRLIERSARELKTVAVERSESVFILPRPGCGEGSRRWEEVKPVLERVGMPRNVWLISEV